MFKKHGPFYRPILKKAWEITKQNRFLWVFGLFAALAGNGGIYEILVKGFDRVAAQGEAISPMAGGGLYGWGIFTLPRLEDVYEKSPLFVNFFWMIALVVLIVLGALVCLNIASRSALINCVKKITGRRKTNLKDGWEAGKKYFWPVLGLNVLSKAATFSLLVLITVPVMFFIVGGSGSFGWNLFLYVASFVVFTLLALFVSFMAIYASCFAVLEGLPFVEAIRASWTLFIKNWFVSLEMSLILFLTVILAGLALILFSVFYLIPVSLLLLAFAYLQLEIGFWIIVFLAILGWFVLVGFIGAVLSTFQFSAWTLLFTEINKKRIWSKLLRFVGLAR
jgi:hypothetical protein